MAEFVFEARFDDGRGGRLVEELRRFAESFPELTLKAMYTSAMFLIVPAIQKQIRENKSVFRGDLHQRVGCRTAIDVDPAIEFGSLGVNYAANVELGAPPHTPNLEKLREYVKKKMDIPEPRASIIAAAIKATIEKEGSKPHPFVTPAWELTRRAWLKDTVARIKRHLP